MRKSKNFLLKRDISDLAQALEILIDDQVKTIQGLGNMLPGLTDPALINKAYKEIGDVVESLRPVQYLVEHQAPGMKELFDTYKTKEQNVQLLQETRTESNRSIFSDHEVTGFHQ